MIKAILSDFSRTILFTTDSTYTGGINSLYREIKDQDNFVFWDTFRLNEELLAFYESLEIPKYILTSGTMQESEEITSKIGHIFVNMFNTGTLGAGKNKQETYENICDNIGLKPEEILFIDDLKENIAAAKNAGLEAIVIKTNEQVIAEVRQML